MNSNTDEIERAVIDTYKRELPSVHFLEKKDEFERRKTMRENHFRFALNFPPEMFAGRRLLDLGGGTGENTVFYSLWGADCTIVDANPTALERARMIFDTIAQRRAVEFIEASLFDFRDSERFDIVISDGVCHHTSDKKGCFGILASQLKPGGYCYFGIGNAPGQLQRNLQRLILYKFSENDDHCVELAQRLFPEHLDRASRFGQRTKRAIVFDTFIAPKHDLTHVSEVLRWFEENGLVLYSSYPKIHVPFACDGPDRGTFLELLNDPLVGVIPELFWMTHNVDDAVACQDYFSVSQSLSDGAYWLSQALNNIGPDSTIDARELLRLCRALRDDVDDAELFRHGRAFIIGFLSELDRVLSALASNSLEAIEREIANAQYMFKGPHGLGLSYFVAYKP